MGNLISNIGKILVDKDWECKSSCPAGVSCDCSLDGEQNKEKKHDKEEECVSRQNSSERVM